MWQHEVDDEESTAVVVIHDLGIGRMSTPSQPSRSGRSGPSSSFFPASSLTTNNTDFPSTLSFPVNRVPFPSQSSFRMASRALAQSLRQAARSRKAINSVKSPLLRGFATPVSHGTKTESTTLNNGFTVRLCL